MKKLNLKKFLSLFLTLALCLSMATTAFAAEETDPKEPDPDPVKVLADDAEQSKDDAVKAAGVGADATDKTRGPDGEGGAIKEANTAEASAKDATETAEKLEKPVGAITEAVINAGKELDGHEVSDVVEAVETIDEVVLDVQTDTNEEIDKLNNNTTTTVGGAAGTITTAETAVENISKDVNDKLTIAQGALTDRKSVV